ncbi:MAG: nucleotide exchange factor GrpE [Minwuia sp.]|uniref:nucleotide exchange factor GrpE n=1 Tax=Minwuia sp. TaxID=2493630 RepID=UPI003A8C7FC7
MTDQNDKPASDKTPEGAEPEKTLEEATEAASGGDEAAAEAAAADAASIVDEEAPPVEPDPVAVLEEENAALKDRLMRTMAELENNRRRAQRDREDALKYGAQKFARDMCEVADNLQRALDATAEEDANAETKAVLEGVKITRDSLKQIFERHGVQEIDAQDQKFDPNLHEAMTEIDVPGAPPSTCIQVIERGYTLNGRLLRPARVVVTKSQSQTGNKVDTSA